MFDLIQNIFTDYTIRIVSLGAVIVGAVSGALGCFAFLRRQSLVGDVVAHSSLAGITIAFLLSYIFTGSGTKQMPILLLGAAISGILSMWLVSGIIKNTRIKSDSALGVMLAVFFGTGVFFIKYIQQRPIANKAGLEDYIFGMAATITFNDLIYMLILGFISFLLMFLFWKEFKIFSFDEQFTESIGFKSQTIELLINAALVLAIISGLQAVGVILMVALIVAPASAARQWTNSLSVMVVLAAFFGGLSGLVGALLSSTFSNLPTGPTIVLTITSIFLFSLLFAPQRGLLSKFWRERTVRNKIRLKSVLLDLHLLELNHPERMFTGHHPEVLKTMTSGKIGVKRSLKMLFALQLVEYNGDNLWVLSDKGKIKAEEILKNVNKELELEE